MVQYCQSAEKAWTDCVFNAQLFNGAAHASQLSPGPSLSTTASGIVSADLRDRVLSAVRVAVSTCRSQEQLKAAAVPVMVTILVDNRLGCKTYLIDSKNSSL